MGHRAELGIQGKHMVLTHNGSVLVWSTGDSARVWSTSTGAFALALALFGDMHCAGQVMLAHGRVMVIGGQNGATRNSIGVNVLFDSYSNIWTQGASMVYNRWYLTATTLPDGCVLANSGEQPDGTRATVPEIYDLRTNTWAQLPGAIREQRLYPLMFVLPDGRLYESGTFNPTYFLSTTAQAGASVPLNTFRNNAYAEYVPGKILRTSGGDPAFAKTAIIDNNTPSAQWKTITAMAFPRRRHNLVILADGQVMAVGGTRQADSDGLAVLKGEIWNPATELWAIADERGAHVPFQHPAARRPRRYGGRRGRWLAARTNLFAALPVLWCAPGHREWALYADGGAATPDFALVPPATRCVLIWQYGHRAPATAQAHTTLDAYLCSP